MNFEGACALAIVLWIAIRASPTANSAPAWKPLRQLDWMDVLGCALICVAIGIAFWRAAHIRFLSDDFVLVAHAPDFQARWAYSNGGGDGFYRPLVYQIISWTRRWAGVDPTLWHAAGLAVHAANAILLYLVAWALGYSRFASGFATALFAMHATRAEVAIWVGGRFDLFATMFVLAALFLFVRGYRLLALLAMIAGLLCKESAYAFPMMLVALAAWKREWHGKPAAYFSTLAGFFGAAAILFTYRWHLVGGIGGYRNSSGEPEILSLGLLGVVKGIALRLWAVLFFPVNWIDRPGAFLIVVTAIYGVALLWLTTVRVRRPAFLLPLALLLATAVPVVHLLLIGPDLEKSRYLYLPSAAFALLLAVAIEASKQKWMVAGAVLMFQVTALEHNLAVWEVASAKVDSACGLVAASAQSQSSQIAVVGLPSTLKGAYFFGNGLPECVELRNPQHPLVMFQRDARISIDRAKFQTVFEWDRAMEELKQRP